MDYISHGTYTNSPPSIQTIWKTKSLGPPWPAQAAQLLTVTTAHKVYPAPKEVRLVGYRLAAYGDISRQSGRIWDTYEILYAHKRGARGALSLSRVKLFGLLGNGRFFGADRISEKKNDSSIPLNLPQFVGYVPKNLKQYISFRECERPIFAL